MTRTHKFPLQASETVVEATEAKEAVVASDKEATEAKEVAADAKEEAVVAADGKEEAVAADDKEEAVDTAVNGSATDESERVADGETSAMSKSVEKILEKVIN